MSASPADRLGPRLESPVVGTARLAAGRPVPGRINRIQYRNDRLAGRPVTVHFGFDGWNRPLTGPGSGWEDFQGNRSHFVDAPMQWNPATGAFEADLAVPAGARAVHAVFCWDSCGPGQWDNNNRRDFNWPVVFPYIGPFLTWNEQTPPATGVVVTFEHPPGETDGEPWLEFMPARAPERARRVAPTVRDQGLYRFVLRDLRPATAYVYRVGVGTLWRSVDSTFSTLSQGGDRVRFAVFGDAQDHGEFGESKAFAAVAQGLLRQASAYDFILSTGDLPWNNLPGDWWTFFDKGRGVLARKVMMPAVGNHDTPGVGSSPDHRDFVRFFAPPGTSAAAAHYAFTAGPATFLVMNSERPEELAPGGPQDRWLRDRLAAQKAAAAVSPVPLWTFAAWHIPPFNAGARHWTQQWGVRSATAGFEGVVDWHFGGHEHLYQRFAPLALDSGGLPERRSAYGTGHEDGVGYLVVPSGGAFPESRLVAAQDEPLLRSLLDYPVVPAHLAETRPFRGFALVAIAGRGLRLAVHEVLDGRGRSAAVDTVDYQRP